MAIGLAQSSVSPDVNRTEKEKTYEVCRRFMHSFAQSYGSTLCGELLGCDISTPEGLAQARQQGLFQSRCSGLVRGAVNLVPDMLAGN